MQLSVGCELQWIWTADLLHIGSGLAHVVRNPWGSQLHKNVPQNDSFLTLPLCGQYSHSQFTHHPHMSL